MFLFTSVFLVRDQLDNGTADGGVSAHRSVGQLIVVCLNQFDNFSVDTSLTDNASITI